MKILKNIFLAVWTLWCLIGVIGNFFQYKMSDWVVIIPFVAMPYLIIWFITYKINKRKASTTHVNENQSNANSFIDNNFLIRSKESKNNTLSENVSAVENTEAQNNLQYIETDNTVYRTDGEPISDEEIPYLIQAGYENALAFEHQNANPKFHRTAHEEDLSFNFEMKYGDDVDSLTEKFETLYRNAYKTDNLSERISQLEEAVKAFEKAKRFCYSKGKGGTIYFQDMWEYMHNSQNQCYSYLDNIKSALNETVFEKDVAIPNIINIISENDGIFQKNIYELLPDMDKSTIQRITRKLESENRISRIKRGNSYELHLIKTAPH